MESEIKPLILSFSDIKLYSFIKIIERWSINFLQIEPGIFKAELKQYITNDLQLGYAKFNKKVKQEGFSPEGIWTFAFVNDINIYWRNYKVFPNSIIIYTPGSEINAVSDAGFEVLTFSVKEEYLSRIIKQENKGELIESLKKRELLKSNQPLWSKLRMSILLELDKRINKLNSVNDDNFKEIFTKELLNLLENSIKTNDRVSSVKRLNTLKIAEDYIIKHITEPITVSKLAIYLKVSERTLLYVFKNRFNIGPKTFIKVLKLNHLHYRLQNLKVKDSKTIASIARDSGFWHMGQLYKDYKMFFGELPSETIKKTI